MKKKLHIINLEDNARDAELNKETLAGGGIECEMVCVETREDFIAAIEQGGVDIILADYSVPSFDGLSALELARERRPDVPFIFVTGTLGEEIAIEALKNGAADYVLKERLLRLAPAIRRALKERDERDERKRVREEVVESGNYLSKVMDAVADPIFVKDRAHRWVLLNNAFCTLCGHGREEMLGKSNYDFFPPSEADVCWAMDDMVFDSGVENVIEGQFTGRKGVVHTMLTKKTLYRDKKGEQFIVGIIRDVTELKRAEQARRESEERYQILFRNHHIVMLVIDPETAAIVDANPAAVSFYGYRSEDLLNLGLSEINTSTMEEIKGRIQKILARRENYFTTRHRLASGDVRDVEVYSGPINIGRKDLLYSIVIDKTEQKRAEEALRESEERFAKVFRSSPICTSITRMSDGQFLDVNDAFIRLFGYEHDDVIGCDPLKLNMWANPADRDLMVETLQEKGRTEGFETIFRTKSGELRNVFVVAELVDVVGERYVLGLSLDITGRKRAEEEKRKLEEQLLQAQKLESVGRLAGGVAHDFNNMLMVIQGHAEMALDQVDPTQQLFADLQEIRKAAERSANLTRQLLAFARKQTVAPKVLDLNETVEGMLKMLRRLIGEDIDLSWLPGGGLWQVKVDPSQIDQILANLCVNARDAISGVGKLTIETENIAFDETYCVEHARLIPGEYVLLAVSDDGCGMDKEILDKLFEPFFTTKEMGKGTGLGLATVYDIVKQNNGFINVYSEPGQGTTFRVYLPRHRSKAEQMIQEEGAVARPTRGRETILLVEDEPSILNMTARMLESLGYTVLAEGAPGAAIRRAESYPGEIHLLVTDVVMPEMNGRDLAKNILALYPNIKRLFMSGYTANVIVHHGVLDAGVHFLQKPFSMQDLAAKLREMLGANDK